MIKYNCKKSHYNWLNKINKGGAPRVVLIHCNLSSCLLNYGLFEFIENIEISRFMMLLVLFFFCFVLVLKLLKYILKLIKYIFYWHYIVEIIKSNILKEIVNKCNQNTEQNMTHAKKTIGTYDEMVSPSNNKPSKFFSLLNKWKKNK